jgi:hypothetical protein
VKPWVKDTIKSGKLGYLVVLAKDGVRTIPLPYQSKRGRLISTLSVLMADTINDLKKAGNALFVILSDDRKIDVRVRIEIGDRQLQEQGVDRIIDHYFDRETMAELDRYDYFGKRVSLTMTPQSIQADSADESLSYDLEIL